VATCTHPFHLSGTTAHQGIHRLLYAYFMGLPREEAPFVSIPLNTVIELHPHAYGCEEKRYVLLSKEEMLKDGQDEPITSMPMQELADRANSRHVHTKSTDIDPMNPPSF
jgi:broad specificity phosphatase PhoE